MSIEKRSACKEKEMIFLTGFVAGWIGCEIVVGLYIRFWGPK